MGRMFSTLCYNLIRKLFQSKLYILLVLNMIYISWPISLDLKDFLATSYFKNYLVPLTLCVHKVPHLKAHGFCDIYAILQKNGYALQNPQRYNNININLLLKKRWLILLEQAPENWWKPEILAERRYGKAEESRE